jgi:hypothetical protein
MLGSPQRAEKLAASQGGLSSMKLVSLDYRGFIVSKNLLQNFSKGIFKIEFIQFSEKNI